MTSRFHLVIIMLLLLSWTGLLDDSAQDNIRPADTVQMTALIIPRTTNKKGMQNYVHAVKVNSCSL